MSVPLSPLPARTRLRVDVWSDVACPWCYIGKRRLEAALAQFPERDQVDVVWHSFELDPDAPAHSDASMRDVLAGKYGRGAAEAQGMLDHVTRTAAQDGLEYHFERARPANTFLAHQLVHLGAARGRQDAVKERLLRAHFTEGEPLGDPETLVRLAAEAGLDAGEARDALRDGTHAGAVRADEAQARAYGISGVPFFVLDGRYGVSGAQPAEVLRGALAQVWAEVAAPVAVGDAEACGDGQCAVPGVNDLA